MRKVLATLLTGVLLNPAMVAGAPLPGNPGNGNEGRTATPIKHLVVIFQENISFDHYFGTYPVATNPKGEPQFHGAPGTPTVNGLTTALLNNNPNLNPKNGAGATNPFRFDRSAAATEDQNHDYLPEQEAFAAGLMDAFPEFTGTPGPPPSAPAQASTTGQTMGYFDGNTVTAYWNYAQHYAMSDNSYGTGFGPSTPGALNLVSGQTIGNLLNAAGVSWGFFQGGFDLSIVNANGSTGCGRSTTSAVTATKKADYIPHHQPFQYYPSTANPTHARPLNVMEIGHAGPANHQYDTLDFFAAVKAGNFPAVSFLKAPGFQDGHPGYSDPLDEQKFVVDVINFLQTQPEWSSTAVVINYDDSDGWYDHQLGAIVNTSATAEDVKTGRGDALTSPGMCGTGTTALPGVNPATTHAQGRCGYGPRMPYMVISPWARRNFVDHTMTDQSSTIHFIEDNWLGGKRIGQGSYDGIASSITQMFDFNRPPDFGLFLLNDQTGEVEVSFPF